MHECVKKLLVNVENPEEEDIESLCQLLKTVGQLLDMPKARARMDVYFTRMKELGKSTNVSSRMQFMLEVCDESGLLGHYTDFLSWYRMSLSCVNVNGAIMLLLRLRRLLLFTRQ